MASNATTKAAPKSGSVAANKKVAVSRQKPLAAKTAANGKAVPRKAGASSSASAAVPTAASTKPAAAKMATKAAKKPVTKPVTKKAEAKAVAKPAVAEKVKTTKVSAAPQAQNDAAPASKEKAKKAKLVRDSFTMPEPEYRVLADVKKACLKAGIDVKKSELLRVGVAMIKNMDLVSLKNVLATLAPLKAGRPKSAK